MVTANQQFSSPDFGTLADALLRRSDEHAGAEAFTFIGGDNGTEVQITFGQLDVWARCIALQIQEVTRPGERVLVLCPPGLDYIASLYGAFYAGVIPVLFTTPRSAANIDGLVAVVRLVDAAAVVSTQSMREMFETRLQGQPEGRQLRWIETGAFRTGIESGWRDRRPASDSVALLMCTSGTSGVPKAVIWKNSTLSRILARQGTHIVKYAVPNQRTVAWTPPFHMLTLIPGILLPMQVGFPATHLPPDYFLADPLRWLQIIAKSRATTSGAPTYAYDACAASASKGVAGALDLSCWTTAMLSAEMVRHATMERFAAAFAPAGFNRKAFSAGYGMTEIMGVCSPPLFSGAVVTSFSGPDLEQNRVVRVEDGAPSAVKIVSQGPILPNARVVLVDPVTLVRRQHDEVGELLAATDEMSEGYWGASAEDGSAFHTFVADTGEGPFMRSGDLAIIFEGELYITGRSKELIVIRGRNVSPNSIETTVERSHAALTSRRGAAISLDVSDEERLVIVQEVDPTGVDLDDVIRSVRGGIGSGHEIQVHRVVLVPVGALPKTAAGKIQRLACKQALLAGNLPILAESTAGNDRMRPYVAPRTPTEAALCRIWEDILGLERVGLADDFFEMGGDSLLSMRVVTQAQQAGIYFSVQDLIENSSIEKLAPLVAAVKATPPDQGAVVGPVPLSPTQLHFFDDVPEHHKWYGLPYTTALPRALDPESLRIAVDMTIRHHDALRLRFAWSDNQWLQHSVKEETHECFLSVDVSGKSEEVANALTFDAFWKVRDLIDLDTGPMIAVAYVHGRSDGSSLLIVRMHHLVMDAFSISIWYEDLATVYEQVIRGRVMQLPAKTTSFKAWSERLREYAQRPELDVERDYWLSGVRKSVAPLPLDFPDDRLTDGMSQTVPMALSVADTAAILRDVPGMFGTEIVDVLLAALTWGIGVWTRDYSLLVELFSHGRDPLFGDRDIDLSRTMGWFTSKFPMFLQLQFGMTAAESLLAIKQQMRAIPNRGLGYGILRYAHSDPDIGRQLAALPQPEVNLNYTGRADPFSFAGPGSPFSDGTPVQRSGRLAGEASRPLTVWSEVRDGRLEMRFQYRENVHRRQTIEGVVDHTRSWFTELITFVQ